MIFRGVVSAMVVVSIASAAMIIVPNITTKRPSLSHELYDDDMTTVKPAEQFATVKPVDAITTMKPVDAIRTVKPAHKISTMKPAAPVPTQAPMISCYCNLPECSVAAGGVGTCSTRLGCYSEVQPIIPGIEEEIVTPTVTESNQTANASSVSPINSESVEFVKAPVVATTEHAAAIRGSYGCLDQLSFAKQSCEELLKSMEAESSEFPVMQIPTNGAAPSATYSGVHAFHCCQTERCNGNQSGPAEGSVKSAQAVLVAALKNAFAPQLGVQNSTVGVPWTPAVESSVNNLELSNNKTSVNNVESSNANTSVNNAELSNANTSVNNVELSKNKTSVKNVESSKIKTSVNEVESFNAEKTNAATSDLWLGYFSSLGEPKAPSPLQSDIVFENASSIDATTPAMPAAMPPTLPETVPASQEITHVETIANVEHVVTKRHDGQHKAVPVLKQQSTIDDQENITDFDDDIAAEVAAAMATAKTPEQSSESSLPLHSGADEPSSDSGGPHHSGVPDFTSPPSLKKNNMTNTTNSIPATRGVKDNSKNHNNHAADNNDSGSNMIGIISTIVILCTIGLSLFMMFVLRTFVRKYDIFRNYKSMCSNPGQPCACSGGFIRRRPRTQPSSSHRDAAVNRNACTAPLLPLSIIGHKNRGHANAGASYNDSTGDTTYVFTTIPVPDNVAPVSVVRR